MCVTEAAAPTNCVLQNRLMAGIESRLAKGSTPCGGPGPIHAGDFIARSRSSPLQTIRYEKYRKSAMVKRDVARLSSHFGSGCRLSVTTTASHTPTANQLPRSRQNIPTSSKPTGPPTMSEMAAITTSSSSMEHGAWWARASGAKPATLERRMSESATVRRDPSGSESASASLKICGGRLKISEQDCCTITRHVELEPPGASGRPSSRALFECCRSSYTTSSVSAKFWQVTVRASHRK